MTNNDTNPAAATATDTLTATDAATVTGLPEAAPDTAAPHDKGATRNKGVRKDKREKTSTARRRTAKALAYFALIFTGLLILAEPWLLIPVAALVLAISLWD
ncbi:hypothetical protein [Streptomyces sp. bgisy027]|uniref:hypothetical protein n=1 Tax=Streptomyces sp. bgisy027 TaxID=3413770 RepID=UPI003D733784